MATREEMLAIVHGQADAWRRGDADAVAGAFADPCEFVYPGMRLTSPAQVRASAEACFRHHDQVRIDMSRIVIDGDDAAVEWTWSERRREDGRRSRARDAIVLRAETGKIVYWREYIDRLS